MKHYADKNTKYQKKKKRALQHMDPLHNHSLNFYQRENSSIT